MERTESDPGLARSAEALVRRADVWVTRPLVDRRLASGQWRAESFVHDLQAASRRAPGDVALVSPSGERLTYAAYDRRSAEVADGLRTLGLGPGDPLGLQLPNGLEFCLLFLGCLRAGVLPVLLHPQYDRRDLAYIAPLVGLRGVVVPEQHRGRDLVALARSLQVTEPSIEHVITVGSSPRRRSSCLADLVEAGRSRRPRSRPAAPPPNGLDPSFVMMTSGTTGHPKAQLHLHATDRAWIQALQSVHAFPADSHWLVCTPIVHLTGLGVGVLASLARGSRVSLLDRWDPVECLAVIERDRPTHLLATPAMLVDLAQELSTRPSAPSSVATIAYGGAPCPRAVLEEVSAQFGARIIALYGFTEGGPTHFTLPDDPLEVTSRSFGRAAPGVECRWTDEEGNELEAPCEGELWCRGPSFVPGYYNQPEVTQRQFTRDGWFRSGDRVRVDETGRGEFVARCDDLINRGGYKLDPREIEEVLYTNPAVRDAAVVPVPDERLGERACAFVVARPGAEAPTLDELRLHLDRSGVAKVKWPEVLRVVPELPLNHAGKVMRRTLRDLAVRDLALARSDI